MDILSNLALGFSVAGLHLLGIGAIGGMTLSVMMRATMGHTGRDLAAGGLLAAAFAALAAYYEAVHRHLLSPGVRDELVAQSPRCAAELPRTWPPVYATLAEHNRELRRLLTRFVLDRSDDWSPDFHAQLLF